MHINFLRTGVGVSSVDHLYEIQNSFRNMKDGGRDYAFLITRRTPTRANELINGGSVYWIINRQICVRQTIADIQTLEDEEGKNYCRIVMEKDLTLTHPVSQRHIQGWRYLAQEKAPADLRPFDPSGNHDDINSELADKLAAAGLL